MTLILNTNNKKKTELRLGKVTPFKEKKREANAQKR